MLFLICTIFFLNFFFKISSTELVPEPLNICSNEKELILQTQGYAASQSVILDAKNAENSSSTVICELKITAPKSHVVNLQFLENQSANTEKKRMEKRSITSSSCLMNIYLPDNAKSAFWTGDLCSEESLSDVDLLTSEFRIHFSPPPSSSSTNKSAIIRHKMFVLTAVGSGPFCKDPFQHTCMRIGRIPMLCISDHLICDGIQNCPKSATNSDEDPKLCNTAKNAWQNFVFELFKKYRPPVKFQSKLDKSTNNNDDDEDEIDTTDWLKWQIIRKNSEKTDEDQDEEEVLNETHSPAESISAMLNKYGPWGYLMMGLLICGTVLFFCGLWECCCKKSKPEADLPVSANPTTVLIMDCQASSVVPMPPRYDDLDLPPSYTTLFPGDEVDGRYTSISEEAADEASCSTATEKCNVEVDQIRHESEVEEGVNNLGINCVITSQNNEQCSINLSESDENNVLM